MKVSLKISINDSYVREALKLVEKNNLSFELTSGFLKIDASCKKKILF